MYGSEFLSLKSGSRVFPVTASMCAWDRFWISGYCAIANTQVRIRAEVYQDKCPVLQQTTPKIVCPHRV